MRTGLKQPVSRLRFTAVAIATTAAMSVLAACGSGNVKNASTAGGKSCDPVNMAVNPWVGYEADAYVVGRLMQKRLGCQVTYKNLSEQLSWAGFGSGEVDVIMENWGHQPLVKKYVKGDHSATVAGQTGNVGIIGWFVPPWLAKAHPDITNWNNLNKYASKFQTSESGSQGQLLDGDPSFVTSDASIIKKLNLNYKVVYAGSEAALIQAFRTAEMNHTWAIGYFYKPQWFFLEENLAQVQLPKYTPGCSCNYPLYHLDKVVATSFAKSGSPAYNLVKNFHWTNDDQNQVAAYISKDGMSPSAAADKWIADNASKVNAWLK